MVTVHFRRCDMVLFCASPAVTTAEPKVQTCILPDDGTFPNNESLPLVLLRGVFNVREGISPDTLKKVFHQNDWENSWLDGLYDFHHYHSSAHEALGVFSGWVKGQFGGPGGEVMVARAGDVIIVPAGTAHKNLEQSTDFRVVGAYPHGQMWDMMYGKPGERPQADERIKKVPLPEKDPVFGVTGPLVQLWKQTSSP